MIVCFLGRDISHGVKTEDCGHGHLLRDTGSCCDPDCTGDPFMQTGGVFDCPVNATPFGRLRVLYCSDAVPLETVNLPPSARADNWESGDFDELLCVYKDNSPAAGSFLDSPVDSPLSKYQVLWRRQQSETPPRNL